MRALAAACAGTGVWLLCGALLGGRRSIRPAPLLILSMRTEKVIRRAGPQLLLSAAAAVAGGALGVVLFGAPLPAVALAAAGATGPRRAAVRAATRRLDVARATWPQLIEELRILTGSLGMSIPQALLEVGRRAPAPMRPAFTAAEREWLLTTDLPRTLQVLKDALADPAADTLCETLLVAHELGGSGLEQRLAALADDRDRELQHRRDAEARQAGARFARRFVLIVPAGMALAGMSVGTGRQAYATTSAQLVVLVAIAMVLGCWWWAGRIMVLPEPRRVLDR